MKLSKDTISEIMDNHPRFIDPYDETDPYTIFDSNVSLNDNFDIEVIKRYYERLRYAVSHADDLIKNAFDDSFYDSHFVNKDIVKSSDQMCSKLIFDSFVMFDDHQTIGACLTNNQFMFGHFIDVSWDDKWNIISVWIN